MMPNRVYPLPPENPTTFERLVHHWFESFLSVTSLVMAGTLAFDWLSPLVIAKGLTLPDFPQIVICIGALGAGGALALYSLLFIREERLKRAWQIERVACLFLAAGWFGMASFAILFGNITETVVYLLIALSFLGRFIFSYRVEKRCDALISDHRGKRIG